MASEATKIVDEIVTRTMRHGGFTGDVTVKNVRSRKDGGYSATVIAVVGGGMGRAKYRALITPDRRVKVTRVSEIEIRR